MPFTSPLGSSQVWEQTSLEVSPTGSPGSFVQIANVDNLTLPLKQDIVDVTNVGDHWHRRRPTLSDMGTIAFNVFFVPAEVTHDNVSGGMLYMLINQVLADWQVITPVISTGSKTYAFPAYVSQFSITAKIADVYHAACDLVNDGEPTIG